MEKKGKIKALLKKVYLYKIIFSISSYYYTFLKSLSLLKIYLKNMLFYYSLEHNYTSGKIAYFDLFDANNALHCFPMLHFFSKRKFHLVLRHRYSFISRCSYGAMNIFKLQGLRITRKPSYTFKPCFYFCDHPSSIYFCDSVQFNIKDILKLKPAKDYHTGIFAPYPMHPNVYEMEHYTQLNSYRNIERKMKLFFSGNTHKGIYLQHNIKGQFKMIDRFEIIDTLRKKLTPEKLHIVETRDYIDKLFLGESAYINKFIMVDWQWKIKGHKIELRIDNRDWLYFLSLADFFLACPGVKIPFCHNIIEAMSVGTIPLTNYGHMFNPPLADMQNCISFSNKDELIEKVKFILNMGNEQINIIRKNVLEYYTQHLDYSKFCDELISSSSKMNNLNVFSESF